MAWSSSHLSICSFFCPLGLEGSRELQEPSLLPGMCFPLNTNEFSIFPCKSPNSQPHLSRLPSSRSPSCRAESLVWVAAEFQALPHLFKQLLHSWFGIYKYLGSFEMPRLEMLVSLPRCCFTAIQVGEKVPALVLLLCCFFAWDMKNPFRHGAFHALLHPLEPFLPNFRHTRKNPDVSGIKKKKAPKPPALHALGSFIL